MPLGVLNQGTHLLAPQVLLTGAVVTVLSAVLPYSLELAALRRLPTRTVGVLASLESASAGLAGVLVLDEHLRVVQWAALACVGAANAGAVVRRQGESTPESPVPNRSAGTPASGETLPAETCRTRSEHSE
ncbi:EamA family transporter [Streptomyces sp. ICN988]|nr:EamA family transporter [Streptomyces sp. ICN988]